MAKKSNKNQPERPYDPRFDDPNEFGMDDPYSVSAAVPAPERGSYTSKSKQPPMKSSSEGGCLSLIGGFFQVVINALLLFLLFAAVGFVIVIGGRALGVIKPPVQAVVPTLPPLQIAALPTQAAPVEAAVATDESGVTGETGVEADTCADPAGWWASVAGDYDTVMTAFALAYYAPGQPLADVVAAAQTSRDRAADQPFDDCILGTWQSLMDALDAQLDALRTLEAGDRATAFARSQEAAAQFASVLDGLWEQGVDTGAGSAISAGIPRGGTPDCEGLGAWYAQLQPLIETFNTSVVPVVDFLNANPDDIARARGETVTLYGSVQNMSAPSCAELAQQAAVDTVNNFFQAVDFTFSGNRTGAAEPAVNYARSAVLLDVWLRWLGLTAG